MEVPRLPEYAVQRGGIQGNLLNPERFPVIASRRRGLQRASTNSIHQLPVLIATEPDEVDAIAHVTSIVRHADQRAVSDLDRYLAEGRIELVSHDQWFLKGGAFGFHRVANGFGDLVVVLAILVASIFLALTFAGAACHRRREAVSWSRAGQDLLAPFELGECLTIYIVALTISDCRVCYPQAVSTAA